MLIDLGKEKLISKKGKAKISLKKFRKAISVSADDLNKCYSDDVCLLGIARGGLPFAVGTSHFSGKRNLISLQIQMNKSDNVSDYGEAHFYSEVFDNKYNNFIIFEDIVYKGQSINKAINLLKEKGKNVLAVYTMVLDENFESDNVLEHQEVPIKYVYSIKGDDWVYFPWEKGFDNK